PRGAGAGAVARGPRRVDPARRSGPGPDERDPQLLDRSIDRLVAERGWTTDVAVGGALARWPELMGAELAAHCRPESFNNNTDGDDAGELVLVADSTAWATQVRLLVPALQRRLDDELGVGLVRRIRVLGPSAPSWRRGPLSVRGRGPRDTYG
ncbi:MAG: DciA family protein, partial [Actinomycetota bacterium]|nr:DciA family protein [Actinomycetota bacterium]